MSWWRFEPVIVLTINCDDQPMKKSSLYRLQIRLVPTDRSRRGARFGCFRREIRTKSLEFDSRDSRHPVRLRYYAPPCKRWLMVKEEPRNDSANCRLLKSKRVSFLPPLSRRFSCHVIFRAIPDCSYHLLLPLLRLVDRLLQVISAVRLRLTTYWCNGQGSWVKADSEDEVCTSLLELFRDFFFMAVNLIPWKGCLFICLPIYLFINPRGRAIRY